LSCANCFFVNQKTSRIIGSLLSETVNHNPIVLGIVMGPDPSTTLADFEGAGIPKSAFL